MNDHSTNERDSTSLSFLYYFRQRLNRITFR
nr:MAG TPA: hypothetical protein [Caudoviricetes sp.]